MIKERTGCRGTANQYNILVTAVVQQAKKIGHYPDL